MFSCWRSCHISLSLPLYNQARRLGGKRAARACLLCLSYVIARASRSPSVARMVAQPCMCVTCAGGQMALRTGPGIECDDVMSDRRIAIGVHPSNSHIIIASVPSIPEKEPGHIMCGGMTCSVDKADRDLYRPNRSSQIHIALGLAAR